MNISSFEQFIHLMNIFLPLLLRHREMSESRTNLGKDRIEDKELVRFCKPARNGCLPGMKRLHFVNWSRYILLAIITGVIPGIRSTAPDKKIMTFVMNSRRKCNPCPD